MNNLGKMLLLLVTMTCSMGCAQRLPQEDKYIDHELAKIDAHYQIALKAGKMTAADRFSAENILGDYGWHKGICEGQPCYFGAYTFSEKRFRLVMRGEHPAPSGRATDPNTQFRPF